MTGDEAIDAARAVALETYGVDLARSVVGRMLDAAEPFIERQVRERVVAELRGQLGVTNRAAEQIARGGSR